MSETYFLLGTPRSGNCLTWRQMSMLLGEPSSVDDFRRKKGRVVRSHTMSRRFIDKYTNRTGVIRDPRDGYLSSCYFDQHRVVETLNKHTWLRYRKGFSDMWLRAAIAFEDHEFTVFRYEDMIREPVYTLQLLADAMKVDRPEDPEAILHAVRPETAPGHTRGAKSPGWEDEGSPFTTKDEVELCGRLRPLMEKYGYG